MIKILGIHSSLIKNGNTAWLLDYALGEAKKNGGVETESIALAVGWCRNLGMETTLASLHGAFLVHEMLAPSCHAAGALYGGGVVSGQRDEAFAYRKEKLGAKDDGERLRSTGLLVREAIQTAKGQMS